MNITYTNTITVENYNSLLKSVGWKEQLPEQAKVGLSGSIIFTAECDGIPVGLTRIVTDGAYIAIIVDVIVCPSFQGKGIGKSLMQRALDYLKSNLPSGWFVNISLMAAKGKEGFYEQFGFIQRPNERFGNGMSLWYENKEDSQ